MVFHCRMCGQCCSTMGEIISILEKTGTGTFRIGYSTTFEERDVRLDPDKQDLFFGKSALSTLACPFLREREPGRLICTVHSSRPELCRQYSCFRILILDKQGHALGRVMDQTRFFTSPDPRLNEIWHKDCTCSAVPDESAWEECVSQAFIRAGYHVVK
ncbi:MAG: YkgJ family cysteine cluster protein [Methanomicrobiales archaeon]|nr:YkgJ family cysteine cluster protein [Methanomicrobiales archaeon]